MCLFFTGVLQDLFITQALASRNKGSNFESRDERTLLQHKRREYWLSLQEADIDQD